MRQIKVFSGAISGTTAMTLTSYCISLVSGKNFNEPEILSKLMYRILPGARKKYTNISGWALHYLVGLLFTQLYAPLWEKTKPTVNKGLIFGGLSGIAAILIWKFTLATHPDPPAIDFIPFAIQLFGIHLIFGAFAAIGYRIW